MKIHENEKSAYNLKQNYTIVKQILEHSLEGFCPRDEKFFKEHIKKNIDEFLKCLRDPSLPLIEFREAMASGIYTLDILFSSNHNVPKSSCDLCFWASNPIMESFNCTCMGGFDTSGTSKNDNLLKV